MNPIFEFFEDFTPILQFLAYFVALVLMGFVFALCFRAWTVLGKIESMLDFFLLRRPMIREMFTAITLFCQSHKYRLDEEEEHDYEGKS